jgi:hypothetical protein
MGSFLVFNMRWVSGTALSTEALNARAERQDCSYKDGSKPCGYKNTGPDGLTIEFLGERVERALRRTLETQAGAQVLIHQ